MKLADRTISSRSSPIFHSVWRSIQSLQIDESVAPIGKKCPELYFWHFWPTA